MNNPIFAPVIALAAWTMLMTIWMVVARFGGMSKIDPALMGKPGMRAVDVEAHMSNASKWPGHNLNNLMEQPTVFYVVALVLAMLGHGTGLDLQLAWGYVGLRVIHSVIQGAIGNVGARSLVWLIASGVLMVMTVRTAMLVF